MSFFQAIQMELLPFQLEVLSGHLVSEYSDRMTCAHSCNLGIYILGLNDLLPVSYTHLDVYKRQEIISTLIADVFVLFYN